MNGRDLLYPTELRLAGDGLVRPVFGRRAVEVAPDCFAEHWECECAGPTHWCWDHGRRESDLDRAPHLWLVQDLVNGRWTPSPDGAASAGDATVVRTRAEARRAVGVVEVFNEVLPL